MNHFRACSANRKSARRTGAPLDVFPSFSLVRRQKSRFCCLWKINERRCDVFIIEKSMEQNGTRRHAQQCWMWASLFVVRPAATIRVGTDSFRWIPPSVTFFGTREHSFFSPGHSLTRPLFAGRDYFFFSHSDSAPDPRWLQLFSANRENGYTRTMAFANSDANVGSRSCCDRPERQMQPHGHDTSRTASHQYWIQIYSLYIMKWTLFIKAEIRMCEKSRGESSLLIFDYFKENASPSAMDGSWWGLADRYRRQLFSWRRTASNRSQLVLVIH